MVLEAELVFDAEADPEGATVPDGEMVGEMVPDGTGLDTAAGAGWCETSARCSAAPIW